MLEVFQNILNNLITWRWITEKEKPIGKGRNVKKYESQVRDERPQLLPESYDGAPQIDVSLLSRRRH